MYPSEKIGITSFRTTNFDFNGGLFKEKEDFIVQEIENDGEILSTNTNDSGAIIPENKKDFLIFTLIKKGVSTQDALKTISRDNHVGIKRIGYLGNKDRNAITSQRISLFKGDANTLKKGYGRFFIKDLAYADSGCKIGALYGNRFTIRIRDFIGKKDLDAFLSEIRDGMPNFYGPQHFGTSALNIAISKSVVGRNFKQAMIDFAFTERDESGVAKSARGTLKDTFYDYVTGDSDLDHVKANEVLSSLPGFMHSETSMIRHLLGNRHDYIGALRSVPKYFLLLIIQSLQAYVFNLTLSRLDPKGDLSETLPTIGYDLELSKLTPNVRDAVDSVLAEEKLDDLAKLEIKEMPEASLKTFERETLVYPENLAYDSDGNDVILHFDLKKGAYATIFLLEMFKRF